LGQFGTRAKSMGPKLQDQLKASLKDPSKNAHPTTIAECMKKIGAEDLIVPVVVASLGSKNEEERMEAYYMGEDEIGAKALAPIEAAIANGQLRENQDVTRLLTRLRKRAVNE